jgi:hypothetical protein
LLDSKLEDRMIANSLLKLCTLSEFEKTMFVCLTPYLLLNLLHLFWRIDNITRLFAAQTKWQTATGKVKTISKHDY